jgi:hypothetical protein
MSNRPAGNAETRPSRIRNWRRVVKASNESGNGDSRVNFPLSYFIGDQHDQPHFSQVSQSRAQGVSCQNAWCWQMYYFRE